MGKIIVFGSAIDHENPQIMLTDSVEKIAIISPRMGVALARFYISIFQSSKRLAVIFGTCIATAGKVMWIGFLFLIEYFWENINMPKLMGVLSALFALVSGCLWFFSASLQQALAKAETTEELATVFSATMEWQTYAGLTAVIAALLALCAALSAKE